MVSSLFFFILFRLIFNSPAGIFKLEWQHGSRLIDYPDLIQMDFNLLWACCDWLLWCNDSAFDINNWFLRDLSCELNHSFANLFSDEENTLDCSELFPNDHEQILSKRSTGMNPTSDLYFLVEQLLINILDSCVLFIVSLIRVALWPVDFQLSEESSWRVIGTLLFKIFLSFILPFC